MRPHANALRDPLQAPGDDCAVSEQERLSYLAAYHILDTAPEGEFDRLVRMVRNVFDAPIALLSFLDEDRQWFKASVGLDNDQAPRDIALCNTTICSDLPLIVSDACADPRFCDNPYVVETPHLRAYAGAPLIVAPGVRIGTIGIVDVKPRTFSSSQIEMLVELSRVAVDELRLKRAAREAELARDRLNEAIEVLPVGFMLFDKDDRLIEFNPRMVDLFPECADSLRVGQTFESLLRETVARGGFPDAVGDEERWVRDRVEYHRNPSGVVEQRTSSGGWVRIHETRTETGNIVGFRVDISEAKRREAELFEIATRDALTGVFTRRSILDEMEHEVSRAQRYGCPYSVLTIDVDHFKRVNDGCGHQVGDLVLKSTTDQIIATIRDADRVGRLGGEEFIVLLSDTDLPGAMLTAERIRREIEGNIVSFRRAQDRVPEEVKVTVSIGVADLKKHETFDDLYGRADACLYAAKARGRNQIVGDCDIEHWASALDIAG